METHRKLAMALLGIASLMAVLSCSRQPDDRQLTQTIQSQIHHDNAINGSVTVSSANGVVTLDGQVPNYAARSLAAREAADTPGVKQVINNLTVQGDSSQPTTGSAGRPARQTQAQAPRVRQRPAAAASYEPQQAANQVPPEEPQSSAAPSPEPQPVQQPAETVPAPPPPPPPPPAPVKHTIPSGTNVNVRLIDSLDSNRNKPGDTFRATLRNAIREDNEVVVPAGADVEGRVVESAAAGRLTGHAELKLELVQLSWHGHKYTLNTEELQRAGEGRGKGTAEAAGGGAVLGALIGAIAGGGKGAAIGTIAGAGAGGAARGARKGKGIVYPSETVLTFRLQEPITVVTLPDDKEPER
ncbi:MAG: BON domain-containing protein [Bryobacteraceae bacterium]